MDRTNLVPLPDMSSTVQGRLVRLKGGQIRSGIFSSTFDDCFRCNLFTVSLIDLILLSLAS
jgi:hypothetical protein